MEISINALTARTEDLLHRWASAEYRELAGLSTRPLRAKLLEDFPELTNAESFLQVRQASESPRIDADKKAGLQRLLRFLSWTHRLGRTAEGLDDVAAELEKTITSSLKTMPLSE